MFERYKTVFGQKIIVQLRALDSSKKRDSSFILLCMKTLFGNVEQLKYVTACGHKNRSGQQQKSNLPPEKRKILDDIFIERLRSIEEIDEEMVQTRHHRLNVLISYAISNIVRVSGNLTLFFFVIPCKFCFANQ